MSRQFDIVVLGTGSAASAVAGRCRKAGWSVAVVDSRPYGGTCALRGCDPKKVLVGAAEAIDHVRLLEGKGLRPGELRIEWRRLIRFKRTFTEPVPGAREKAFERAGIETFHGRARFAGPTTVEIGGERLEGRYVFVGTGARPADLGIPGEEHVATSDEFLDLDDLPGRVVFVGGGYISFEFAHVAARAGARVTVLHRGERPLERFDPELVSLLVERTRRLGIALELGTEVRAVERTRRGYRIRARGSGEERCFEAGLVVHGAGRVPEIDELGLEKAGVKHDRRGIEVNEFFQSVSNPRVYAAGDATATGPPLTPVAGYEGAIAAANLIEGNHRKGESLPVPSVVFTLPPLASVGLGEEEARSRGRDFRVNFGETSGWYSSRRIGEECSGYKVLVEERTDRILGAHLLGPHAEETINLFTLAMSAGATVSALKRVIFAYPTHGSDVRYML